MKDALDRKLNIDDHVALMVENYNNRFEGFVSGIVIGFTENYVKRRSPPVEIFERISKLPIRQMDG